MSKLRQLQSSNPIASKRTFNKGKQLRKPALAIVSGFVLIVIASSIYLYSNIANITDNSRPIHKANDDALLNVPGGQLIPSLEKPLNILVMGVDSNGKNTERFNGTRSDTMILVSLDPAKQRVGVVSVPRDSRVPIANGRGVDKINSAHALGGHDLAVATVSSLFNIPIDRYLVVDTQGLKEIFESIGSVDVLVEKKMNYVDHTAKLFVNLEPGRQTLTANQIEQYIRFRHDAKGDIGRIERQQWFARQLLNKITEPEMLVRLPSIVDTIRQSVLTDLSPDEMVRIFGFACHLKSTQLETASLPGVPGSINGISYWLLDMPSCNAICGRLVDRYNTLILNQSADSAIAYASDVSEFSHDRNNRSKPWSAIIKYPKGSEDQVTRLQDLLSKNNFSLRGKYSADLADCQHEQIVQSSPQALDFDLEDLRNKLPDVKNWASVINIDTQPAADFTFVITPETKLVTAEENDKDQL